MALRIKAALAGIVICGAGLAYAEPDHPLVDEHEWISKYSNPEGTNCCGEHDTFALTHEEANALAVGDTVTIPTAWGDRTFTVKVIHPTEDPKGLPWITSYGCLFVAQGT